MKIYTNPTCHYCKKIKDSLDNANVKYEEINASENQTEWNELVRITGIGITPTILMQEEVWIPNRDFRTPEELIQRIQHFEKNPMTHLSIEERIDQVNNNVKNLVLMINNHNNKMAIKSEKIKGKLIINEYDSSNLKYSEYDTTTQELVMEFKKGGKYSYSGVPLKEFTKMRMAESQGSYFSKNISKNYKYKKLS